MFNIFSTNLFEINLLLLLSSSVFEALVSHTFVCFDVYGSNRLAIFMVLLIFPFHLVIDFFL